MDANWLFQIPEGSVKEVQSIIQAQLDADPEARRITDEEAEAFIATAATLAFAEPRFFALLSAKMSIHGYAKNKLWRKNATLRILRSWRDPITQEMLLIARSGSCYPDLAAANEGASGLQMQDLIEAYDRGHAVVHLCHLLRLTDRADQIPLLLDGLDDHARSIYPLHLDVGRLMIRRIVDGVPQQPAESPRAANQLKAQLRQKAKGTKQIERAMREQQASLTRQGRWRKAKEGSLEAYLTGVQHEVAAAAVQLAETEGRLAEEEAGLLAEQAAQLADVAAETAALQAAFAQQLRAGTTSWPLSGLRIALVGEWGEPERLLIETAGGHLVPTPAEQPDLVLRLGQAGVDQPSAGLFCTPEAGPAALERLLHRRILPQITRFRPN